MNINRTYLLLLVMQLLAGLAGCAGTQTFTTAARAGETDALSVGWLNLKRQNLTITITPATGTPVTYLPNDPAVRAVINLYPNPSSGLVVGTQTQQNLGNNDAGVGNNINSSVTNMDREWWQSTILLDLPTTLAAGTATISIADSAGTAISPIAVSVLPGTASSNLFNIYAPWGGGATTFSLLSAGYYPKALRTMETTARYEVAFNSYLDVNGNEVVPHSIQAEFTHTSGVGKPWVVNARGDIKNIIWSDNGTNLKVMVTPTKGTTLGYLVHQKFYVAGGITALTLST